MSNPSREVRPARSTPTVQLATKISPELKSKLEEISEADQVTIRSFIETAIANHWDEMQGRKLSA